MSMNVLVVDDSAVMRAMIIRVLRMSGLALGEVREAADGRAGLAALAAAPADLLLADINMPVMPGDEMIATLREQPAFAALPVVVVSTDGSEARLEALRRHGVSFVHKPFTPEALRRVIIQAMGVPDEHRAGGAAAPGVDLDF